jgi:hypothetical protein
LFYTIDSNIYICVLVGMPGMGGLPGMGGGMPGMGGGMPGMGGGMPGMGGMGAMGGMGGMPGLGPMGGLVGGGGSQLPSFDQFLSGLGIAADSDVGKYFLQHYC